MQKENKRVQVEFRSRFLPDVSVFPTFRALACRKKTLYIWVPDKGSLYLIKEAAVVEDGAGNNVIHRLLPDKIKSFFRMY